MLKQRLITAAILIPLVVLAILKLPTNILQWCIAGITVLAAWEWFAIVGIHSTLQRSISFILLIAVAILAWLYINPNVLLVLAVLVWLLATLLIICFAHSALPVTIARIFNQKWFGLLVAILVLVPFWFSATLLHQSSTLGPQQLLYVMVAVWLADTGGYFAGKRWGKQKLASVISPNKTWQGVYGALALVSVWAIAAYCLGIHGQLSIFTWIVLTFVTVLLSMVGDLFESLFKRSHQVKDSGNLLPGHGGMLDRIDSLLAAVPVFVAGLFVLGAI
ncbi:phosphatidate cytidylyltransferase [Methylophaga sp. 42_25_T18]|nr:phosphatidate cytidylyltransferase [Methylophaga sp. 42_25_T18]OUR87002.1 phosphatidate cytidylyltransferase [Methylophaga sp. 42_8_T64]